MLYQTHVQVHLGNIRHNIESIKKTVGNDCKVLIAVKADAYGHGAVEVSRMAEKENWELPPKEVEAEVGVMETVGVEKETWAGTVLFNLYKSTGTIFHTEVLASPL